MLVTSALHLELEQLDMPALKTALLAVVALAFDQHFDQYCLLAPMLAIAARHLELGLLDRLGLKTALPAVAVLAFGQHFDQYY